MNVRGTGRRWHSGRWSGQSVRRWRSGVAIGGDEPVEQKNRWPDEVEHLIFPLQGSALGQLNAAQQHIADERG